MLEEFLKTASQIATVSAPVLMVLALYAFMTNKIVTAQTLKERDAAQAQAIADRDKSIAKWEQKYDNLQAFAFRLADITDRTAAVAAKAAGVATP